MLICCEDQQKGLFGCHGFKNQVPWRPRDLMTMPLCQSMPIHGTMPGYVLSLLLLLSLLSGQIHGVKSNPASTASCYLRSCTSWFRQLDVTTVCEVVFRCFFVPNRSNGREPWTMWSWIVVEWFGGHQFAVPLWYIEKEQRRTSASHGKSWQVATIQK